MQVNLVTILLEGDSVSVHYNVIMICLTYKGSDASVPLRF